MTSHDDQVRLELTDRREEAIRAFQDDRNRIAQEMAADGTLHSGGFVLTLTHAAHRRFADFAEGATNDLIQLAELRFGAVTEEAAAWIASVFEEQVERTALSFGKTLDETRRQRGVPERPDDATAQIFDARRKRDIAVGRLVLKNDYYRRAVAAVVGDFLKLAKDALADGSEGAKNVAAVLTAAAFEDVMRRAAAQFAGVNDRRALADVLTALKTAGVLAGADVATGQGYLKFRNDSLHADWSNVTSAVVSSCIAFIEGFTKKHFS